MPDRARSRARVGLGLAISLLAISPSASTSVSAAATPSAPKSAPTAPIAASATAIAIGGGADPISATHEVEFWVVAPNEGQSAGGHAAIRIGEWIYHVEHRGDGLIADRRTPRTRFEEIYRLRDNRGIEAIPLDLRPDQQSALGEALDRRYYERKRRLDHLDALESEARWLGAARDRGALAIAIPGLGVFEPPGEGTCSAISRERRRALRERLAERYGPNGLDRARRKARARTLRLLREGLTESSAEESGAADPRGPGAASDGPPAARSDPTPGYAQDRDPRHGHGGAHRRLKEAAQTWAALDLLFECRSVRTAHLERADDAPDPSAPRTQAWERIRAQLSERFVTLIASRRSDVGLSLLLTLARLDALDRSIESGELQVLDPRIEDPHGARSRRDNLPKNWLAQQDLRVRADWQRAVGRFESGDGPLEARFATLERAHHAYRHALDDTLHATASPNRAEARRISPSASVSVHYASAQWRLPWPEGHSHSGLARAHERAVQRARLEREAAADELRYALFTQNCVTELLSLLAAVERMPAPGLAPSTADAQTLLRGRFIPVVAGRFVEQSLSKSARRSMPSTRREQLARTSGMGHSLRELSTLTSQTYRPHREDSSFLFFADGPVWLRPVFGLANLSYGVGAASVGLLRSPFDGGIGLRRGLKGAVMSVPELFFFQVRRGTYLATDPFRPSSPDTNREE